MKTLHYLGPEGSFSHILAQKLNENSAYRLQANESFSKITRALVQDPVAVGLLVVENSITSDVHEAVDLLFTGQFWLLAEAQLKIRMNLIALENTTLDNIKRVASKLPAIAQCSQFIEQHNFSPLLTESTSAALQKILREQDLTTAAIGATALAEQYPGTKVLSADIANQKKNLTRFVLVQKKPQSPVWLESATKITTLVELPHKTGSLADYLQLLAKAGANLTRIESRPVPGTEWEYQFWIDLECAIGEVETIIAAAKNNTSNFQLLGVYERAQVYES